MPKPIARSPLRRQFGRWFFIGKRWAKWLILAKNFAKTRQSASLPFLVFEHSTPLLRKLKDVDMVFQTNKIVNLRLAAERIDGLVLKPGQVFSFWFLVGMPSKKRGFLPGLVLEQGQIKSGTGGGLCQMGNLLHWMALHSPLTVVERWRHGFDVFPDQNRRLPFGSGATLAYNHIDLQLRNDTSLDFQIRVFLADGQLCGELRASEPTAFRYEAIEAEHFFRGEIWGGYSRHNRLERLVFDRVSGLFIKKEPLLTNSALVMYVPFLEEKKPQSAEPNAAAEP